MVKGRTTVRVAGHEARHAPMGAGGDGSEATPSASGGGSDAGGADLDDRPHAHAVDHPALDAAGPWGRWGLGAIAAASGSANALGERCFYLNRGGPEVSARLSAAAARLARYEDAAQRGARGRAISPLIIPPISQLNVT